MFQERAQEIREHAVADHHAERVAARQSRAPVEEHHVGEREFGSAHDNAKGRVEQ